MLIFQGDRNFKDERCVKTHLIVTATRIMIIPTDTMAMMTPQIMYQTLFGSSAINEKLNHPFDPARLSYRLDLHDLCCPYVKYVL